MKNLNAEPSRDLQKASWFLLFEHSVAKNRKFVHLLQDIDAQPPFFWSEFSPLWIILIKNMFLVFLFRNPIVNLGTGIVYPTTHVIQEGPKIFHITSGTYKQPWRTWGIRGEDLLLFGQQIEGEHRNKREVMWMCYVDCCLFESVMFV